MDQNEYSQHLKTYGVEGAGWYSRHVPQDAWGDFYLAEKYLKRYWLPEVEYKRYWLPIQKRIFVNLDAALPELVFQKKFKLIVTGGGCLFTEKSFEQLQRSMLSIGERSFVVIERPFLTDLNEPPFRMKFPTSITWEELMNGNYISSAIVEHLDKEFYVYGESGHWGKFAASESIIPLDIIGFEDEFSVFFKDEFWLSKTEIMEVENKVPFAYKKLVNRF